MSPGPVQMLVNTRQSNSEDQNLRNRLNKNAKRVKFKKTEKDEDSEEEESEVEEEKTRRGPPKKVSRRPAEKEDVSQAKSLPNRVRELPYVDVPPIKQPALTQKAKEPVHDINAESNNPGPAYKLKAPVDEAVSVRDVLQRMLSLPVPVSVEELLGLSPPLKEGTRKQITKVRKPLQTSAYVEEIAEQEESEKIFNPREDLAADKEDTELGLSLSSYILAGDNNNQSLNPNFKVASDPYYQYHLATGRNSDIVYKIHDSYPLQTVFPKINKIGVEEAILDSGSQIVAMARAIAHEMGLVWNPDIQIRMESANGTVDTTLGLAENVLFRFGDVEVYLQVHVIEKPAYKVLLGKPFDVFTRSVVSTQADGGQTVLVTDPNTGKRAMLTTYNRGESPADLYKKKHIEAASADHYEQVRPGKNPLIKQEAQAF
jgi:hypothetical protein